MMKPVRILLLPANSWEAVPLRLDREAREIKNALQDRTKVPFELRLYGAARSRDLRFEMLSYKPRFVHFLGHGEEAGIVLEDDGAAHFVSAEALEFFFETFRKHIRCVFLNRCFSLPQAEAIARHIPFVIGTQEEISDKAAIEFSVAFYEAIGQAERVPRAFQYGISALKLANLFSESRVPVLIQGKPVREHIPRFKMAHPDEPEDAGHREFLRRLTGTAEQPHPLDPLPVDLGSKPVYAPAPAQEVLGQLANTATGTAVSYYYKHDPPRLLEVIANKEECLDFVSLTPVYLDDSEDRCTSLTGYLSDIEIINHDSHFTEILRLWLSLRDSETGRDLQPRQIAEQEIIGDERRIEPRSRRRYGMKFEAFFDGIIPQDGSNILLLRVKAIGHSELEIVLGEDFWHATLSGVEVGALTIKPQAPVEVSRPPQIFLCHSSADKPAVRKLYKRLRSDGFSPWLDEEEILGGQIWDAEIRKAVRSADVVAVCLSRGSVTKSGYVQKEIRFALDVAEEQPEGSIYIIPVKLEECSVPDSLLKWQWVSLFDEGGYKRLLRALQARAGALGL